MLPILTNEDNVIAANPVKFTFACCNPFELEKALPSGIYQSIDGQLSARVMDNVCRTSIDSSCISEVILPLFDL